MKLEKLFSIEDVRRQFFPSRSARWIRETFRAGDYGPVMRDSAGWMIAESAIAEYLARHAVGSKLIELRAGQKKLISRALPRTRLSQLQ